MKIIGKILLVIALCFFICAIIGCKEKETYIVTFDSNGAFGTMASQTFKAGESQVLSHNTFTYCTNTFSNWNTMPNGSGTIYTDGQTITVTSDMTLYAQWDMTTYTVTFNANGGVGDMLPQKFNACEDGVLPQNLFTRENYWFVGWNTAADGTGNSYDNQQHITISDNIILYAKWSSGISGSVEGHDYVDLGLPSGAKWATCNIGASTPEGSGLYFAWGEIAKKWTYTWRDYEYADGVSIDDPRLLKYCCNPEYGKNGFTDNVTTLLASDDAATANWGGYWRMPTSDELNELKNNCTMAWIPYNGVEGMLFTGPNGNSVFFPAAGRYHENAISFCDYYGMYWSSSLRSDRSYNAWNLNFTSEGCYIDGCSRCYGLSVRPVCVQ